MTAPSKPAALDAVTFDDQRSRFALFPQMRQLPAHPCTANLLCSIVHQTKAITTFCMTSRSRSLKMKVSERNTQQFELELTSGLAWLYLHVCRISWGVQRRLAKHFYTRCLITAFTKVTSWNQQNLISQHVKMFYRYCFHHITVRGHDHTVLVKWKTKYESRSRINFHLMLLHWVGYLFIYKVSSCRLKNKLE